MGSFKKVLIYEGKKILLIPLIYFIAVMVGACCNSIGFWHSDLGSTRTIELEEWELNYFYAFCGVLLLCSAYRAFAARKLYEKVRVRAETVFLARIVIIAFAVYAYLLTAMGIGSIRLLKGDLYGRHLYLLSFIAKPWWYAIVFPLSVAFTVIMAYSLVELIKNIFCSGIGAIGKALSLLLPVLIVIFLHAMPMITIDWYTIGNNDYFMGQMPVGDISYDLYMFFYQESDLMFGYGYYTIPYCMLAWNIYNLPLFFAGLITILIGYFSFAFFGLKKNESYLYSSKKGGGNNESNN